MGKFNWFKKNKNETINAEETLQNNEEEQIFDIKEKIDLEIYETKEETDLKIAEILNINDNSDEEFEEFEEVNKDLKEDNEEEIAKKKEELQPIEEKTEQETEDEGEPKKQTFFSKIKDGLSKTRSSILNGIEKALESFTQVDDELFEELLEALIISDIGMDTSCYIIDRVKEIVKAEKIKDSSKIKEVIIRVITDILERDTEEFTLNSPAVLLIIGVNGVGKTTTIGKLTHNFKNQGKKVLIGAGDTFRAAAIDQLQVWADRNKVDLIKHQEGSDPAAVIFDAVKASKARNADILICDTAGRLHNKKNLMEELKKISKIIDREYLDANIETFLVLDATTGQNALQQAKFFSETANITGLILTKLDGSAKGGVVISIKNELNIPVRFIGVGEGLDDLRPFDAKEFSSALFE